MANDKQMVERRVDGNTAVATASPEPLDHCQLDRLAALGTMTAGFAHEICNSLTSVSALVQIIKRQNWPAEQSGQLEKLDEQVGRSIGIARHLLQFSGKSCFDKVHADLDELAEQMISMVRYSHHSAGVKIESIRNRHLPPVRVAPLPMQQAMLNLLLNALDAVKACAGQQTITVRRSQCDGRVNVMVIDYGSGMTQDQAARAFDAFYTTKPGGEGSGLGLTISRELIEQQGGIITLDSLAGFGTIAKISFPEYDSATRL